VCLGWGFRSQGEIDVNPPKTPPKTKRERELALNASGAQGARWRPRGAPLRWFDARSSSLVACGLYFRPVVLAP
jgi:hypothetical protein